MSGHILVERLSALVDDELGELERRELERHLADCAPCRERLEGLREVAGELGSLRRPAPPPALDLWVARRIALERSDRTPVPSWSAKLERWTTPSALLLPFAIVLGLAVVTYVLAHATGRVERAGSETRVVVLPLETLLEVEVARVGERTFRRDEAGWVEAGNGEIPGPAEPLAAAERQSVLEELPGLGELLRDGRVELVWRGARRSLEPSP